MTKTNEREHIKFTWLNLLLKDEKEIPRLVNYQIENEKIIILNTKPLEDVLMNETYIDIDSFDENNFPTRESNLRRYEEGINIRYKPFNLKNKKIRCCWVYYGINYTYLNYDINPNVLRKNEEEPKFKIGGPFKYINVNIARVLED